MPAVAVDVPAVAVDKLSLAVVGQAVACEAATGTDSRLHDEGEDDDWV